MKPVCLFPCVAAAVLALLPGCVAPPSRSLGAAGAAAFPAPGPGWQTSLGQLRYATPQRAVIGEVVVSRHAGPGGGGGDFQLDFTAGPGVPLMSLRVADGRAQAEGLFARGHWRGDPARAGRLGSWTALRSAFAALDGAGGSSQARSPEGASPQWIARGEPEGDGRRVTVEYPLTRERFVFVLAR